MDDDDCARFPDDEILTQEYEELRCCMCDKRYSDKTRDMCVYLTEGRVAFICTPCLRLHGVANKRGVRVFKIAFEYSI